jgi:hypothetical protein
MSAYFQRLIQQSGLRVQEPLAAPASTAGVGAPSPAAGLASASDLLEIHEERTVEATPAAPTPASPRALPPLPVVSATTQPAGPFAANATPPSSAPAEIVIGQRIEASSTSVVPVAAPPQTPAPLPPAPRSEPAPPVVPPAEKFVPQDGVPAEVMQAIMRWIAAGQSGTATPPEKPAATEPREAAAVVVPTPPASSAENRPTAAPAIPERVIEIVEEHFAPTPPPPALALAASVPPSHPVRPAAPPAFTPAEPVHVSIGSINVRIEAPPSAPVPIRPPRAEPAPASAPGRTSHFSKLRRYYLLPH